MEHGVNRDPGPDKSLLERVEALDGTDTRDMSDDEFTSFDARAYVKEEQAETVREMMEEHDLKYKNEWEAGRYDWRGERYFSWTEAE